MKKYFKLSSFVMLFIYYFLLVTLTYAYNCTGNDIQWCINNRTDNTVWLEAKTYNVYNTIVIPSNVAIYGQGKDVTNIVWIAGQKFGQYPNPNIPDPVFMNERWDENIHGANPDTYMSIERLTINGNNTSGGIYLMNTYGYRIDSVKLIDTVGFGGIYTTPNHAHISEWRKYPYRNLITANDVYRSKRPNNIVYSHGIYVTAFDNDKVTISGNYVQDNQGAGIFIEDYPKDIIIEWNWAMSNARDGIWINNGSDIYIRYNTVNNNSSAGIRVEGIIAANIKTYDNSVNSNGYVGIIYGDYGGSNSSYIRHNYIYGPGYRQAKGIEIWYSNLEIDHNEVGNSSYGIIVQGNGSYNTVHHKCITNWNEAIWFNGGPGNYQYDNQTSGCQLF